MVVSSRDVGGREQSANPAKPYPPLPARRVRRPSLRGSPANHAPVTRLVLPLLADCWAALDSRRPCSDSPCKSPSRCAQPQRSRDAFPRATRQRLSRQDIAASSLALYSRAGDPGIEPGIAVRRPQHSRASFTTVPSASPSFRSRCSNAASSQSRPRREQPWQQFGNSRSVPCVRCGREPRQNGRS